MSIYTSYSNPASPLQKKPVKPSPLPKGSPTPRSGDSVKFGANRKNGIWVTTERLPAKAGGLGEVSKTIPDAVSKYTDKDMRIIIPYEEANEKWEQQHQDQAFQPTNLTIQLKTDTGKIHRFQVLQKFEPAINANNERQGNWVYALKSPLFLQKPKKDDEAPKKSYGLSQYTYTGESQESARKVLLFNQAAAELINYLNNPGSKSTNIRLGNGDALQTFKDNGGKVDFVIGNDWLSGPVLYQKPLQQKQNSNIRKIFMLHNTYDNVQGAGFLDHFGLPIPQKLKTVEDGFSPLQLSLQTADAVIANRNYVKTITKTPFSKGNEFVKTLTNHSESARVFDMHHGLAEDYVPDHNAALQEHGENYQFVELPEDTPEGWHQFKQRNKAALQAKLGLNQNPDATIIGWAARLDPFQKGFYTVQNTMKNLLDTNPNLQIVIAGKSDEPSVIQWVKSMNEDERYRGRFYMPNDFVNKTMITQINAGSDFVMLPSLYEPYGLTQLEAMKMGAIPIVHGVDGIRSTVSDPAVNGRDFIGRGSEDQDEAAWDYGQTGILMRPMDGDNVLDTAGNTGKIPYDKVVKPVDVPGYRQALDYERAMRDLELYVSEDRPEYKPPSTGQAKEEFGKQAKHMSELIKQLIKESDRRKKGPLFNSGELEKLTTLKTKLNGRTPSITLKDKQEVFDAIIRHHIVDAAMKPAENSFKDAVRRALGMSDEQRALVRGNAFRYVNERHTWQDIVGRYAQAIDADSVYKAPAMKFHTKSPFAKPEDQDNAGSKSSGSQSTGFFQQAWDWLIYIVSFGWLKSLFN